MFKCNVKRRSCASGWREAAAWGSGLGLGLGLPGEPPRAGATLDAAGRPLYQKLPSLRGPQISPIETFLN